MNSRYLRCIVSTRQYQTEHWSSYRVSQRLTHFFSDPANLIFCSRFLIKDCGCGAVWFIFVNPTFLGFWTVCQSKLENLSTLSSFVSILWHFKSVKKRTSSSWQLLWIRDDPRQKPPPFSPSSAVTDRWISGAFGFWEEGECEETHYSPASTWG